VRPTSQARSPRTLAIAAAVALVCALGHGAGMASGFQHARLYVDPDSHAREQADAWRATRPADAAQMDKIAAQPQAIWFGEWNANVQKAVAAKVSAAAREHRVSVLVAYDIPHRDCGGGYSAGGARSARDYSQWIRRFAKGLGRERASVVLEPDALADLDCLDPAARRERLRLLSSAVRAIRSDRNAAVYLDAGNRIWHPAAVIASRLSAAGIARARGFSVNVSNFDTTARELAYGKQVSTMTGGKPFVIDTSRNGLGPTPDYAWCNPPGRALGRPPTLRTGHRLVDAYLWIKHPGESDGTCNGGPASGAWWPDYALDLARRAAW
jgi:endoglucanase